jgi:hypothetical protein
MLGPVKLEDARIGEYALVLDLLGTAAQMADRRPEWLASLREILDALQAANVETFDASEPEKSPRFFQYGDTIVVPGDSIDALVVLAMRVIQRLHERSVLVQGAIAGGGVFYVTSSRTHQGAHPNADIQTLVGPAVARGHLLLGGARGTRLLVCNQTAGAAVPREGVWEWYSGPARQAPRPGPEALTFNEVRWWLNIVGDEDARVLKWIEAAQAEIAQLEADKVAELLPPDHRRIASLRKRIEHLQALKKVLSE